MNASPSGLPLSATSLRRRAEGTSLPVWLVLALVFVVAWVAAGTRGGDFGTADNLRNIALRSVALGLVAVGQTVVVLAGSLDLSVAYVVSLSAMACSVVMAGQTGLIVPGVLTALLLGVAVGLANGLVITRLKVNPFIATLGVSLVLRGLLNATFDNFAGAVPEEFQALGYDLVAGIPVSVVMLVAVVAVAWFLLHRTPFGHHLYAVGGDPESARMSGIRSGRVLVSAHVLCALCTAASGVFLASRLGAGAPWVGPDGGYDLESIAAVVLGGTALTGGRGRLLGTVAAVLILAVVDSVFNQFQADPFLRTLVRGLIIVGAVALYAYRGGRR
ncbi:ribose/xylose/arabinose/galactoside ABC-type transport system permease subunit [Planotetraspora sp. GP83]